MSDLHERCRKAEAEVAHLQRELTYAKNSFEAQKFLQHREWERAVQAERERDDLRALLRECRPWVARGLDDHPAPTDNDHGLLARIDVALGGHDE